MNAALEPKLTIGGGLPAGIRVGLGIVGNLVGRLSRQLAETTMKGQADEHEK